MISTPSSSYSLISTKVYTKKVESMMEHALLMRHQEPFMAEKIIEPLNKGNIYITNTSPPSVYEACFAQFEKDFKIFLKSRSKELTPGGIKVLTFLGREKEYESHAPAVIGRVLNDMVQEVTQEGLVEEEKLDFFDLPIYGATEEEVRQVIEAEGSFTLETLKTFKIGWDANVQEVVDDFVLDSEMRGEFISKYVRAGLEPLLSAAFGGDVMDELFSRYTKLLAQLIELEALEYTMLVVSMTKSH